MVNQRYMVSGYLSCFERVSVLCTHILPVSGSSFSSFTDVRFFIGLWHLCCQSRVSSHRTASRHESAPSTKRIAKGKVGAHSLSQSGKVGRAYCNFAFTARHHSPAADGQSVAALRGTIRGDDANEAIDIGA